MSLLQQILRLDQADADLFEWKLMVLEVHNEQCKICTGDGAILCNAADDIHGELNELETDISDLLV